MIFQSTKVIRPKHTKTPLKNWESRINTAEHLKAFQGFYNLPGPLTNKQKGRFGEELALHILESKFGFKLIRKNFRTPYGEIDLVMQGDGFVLFVEVKVDLVGREGFDLWSRAQRQRFRRSMAWYAKRGFVRVRGGVVLVAYNKIQLIYLF